MNKLIKICVLSLGLLTISSSLTSCGKAASIAIKCATKGAAKKTISKASYAGTRSTSKCYYAPVPRISSNSEENRNSYGSRTYGTYGY